MSSDPVIDYLLSSYNTTYSLELKFGITLEEIFQLNRLLKQCYKCQTVAVRIPQTFLEPILLLAELYEYEDEDEEDEEEKEEEEITPQNSIFKLTDDLPDVIMSARVSTVEDILEAESWYKPAHREPQLRQPMESEIDIEFGFTPQTTQESTSSLILCQPI